MSASPGSSVPLRSEEPAGRRSRWPRGAAALRLVWAVSVVAGSLVASPASAGERKATFGKKSVAADEKAADEQGADEERSTPSAEERVSKVAKKRRGDLRVAPKFCVSPEVSFDRGPGSDALTFALVDCDGGPLARAQQLVSVLARLRGSPDPTVKAGQVVATGPQAPRAGELSRGVKLAHIGLVQRLDKIARHFPDKRISVVSGYRPQSTGSLHQHARALDIRVAGVRNEDLVAFCKTLDDTGCGYYPNSSFVHVDVRNPGTGKVSWIDASGPGEPARYVDQWPPPAGSVPSKAEPAKKVASSIPSGSENAKAVESAPLLGTGAGAKTAEGKDEDPAQTNEMYEP